MSAQRTPKIGIGIPVFNGENYLEEALKSLLAQTFRDFEIFISDNGSTDGTQRICRQYVMLDSRIHYSRIEKNLGAIANFNNVFKMSRSPYFKWAPHDDIYDPTFLEKCLEVLEGDPAIVLCHTKTAIIDGNSEIKEYSTAKVLGNSVVPHERFQSLLYNFTCYEIFGVIRTAALLKTPLLGGFGHADGILLVQLGMQGRFYEVDEYLYFNRDHSDKSRVHYSTYRQYAVWLDPTKEGKILLPRWRMGFEYVKAVASVPLPWKESIRCYSQMVLWTTMFWKSLTANIAVAALQVMLFPFKSLRKRLV